VSTGKQLRMFRSIEVPSSTKQSRQDVTFQKIWLLYRTW